MAETFGDSETAEKIRGAVTSVDAEKYMKGIKSFDETKWNQVVGGEPCEIANILPLCPLCLSLLPAEDELLGGGAATEDGPSALDPQSARLHRQALHRRLLAGQGLLLLARFFRLSSLCV